ncbi:hypothetical protein EAI_08006 [Harpegnathos saltator]|uniref:Uncharacterized protein n=1 Tax=Harpegnathos saltator TaxID=610380 RepID=E2B6L9_HARSA|nr:hypothetical protein EAI_08006 [Harpegnathos saltator]
MKVGNDQEENGPNRGARAVSREKGRPPVGWTPAEGRKSHPYRAVDLMSSRVTQGGHPTGDSTPRDRDPTTGRGVRGAKGRTPRPPREQLLIRGPLLRKQ